MPPDAVLVPSPAAQALYRHPPFLFFLTGRGFSSFAYQMSAVAVGWQIYALTHSAFALGMIGLTQFIPMAGLTFFAGHAADRYERKRVVQICQLAEGAVAALLAWGSFAGWLRPPEIFVAVAVLGAARAFESPATSAILPGVVPEGLVQKGTTLMSGVFQAAGIIGPALGGIFYAVSPGAPYALMAACWLAACGLNGAMRLERPVTPKEPPGFSALFAGVGFVRRNPTILGTISLDLAAVLLGGAMALFPIYARDILHTGPWGLGMLRGAPAIGGLLMTAALARFPLTRRVGLRMFQAVILFGVTTLLFALSRSLVFSLIMLAVMGAADTVSVVIRLSLVQLATPDDMRGRVGAVNFLFINASNQLGEFESGMTAALFGAVPAAAIGGIGTILVGLLWMKLFPSLRSVERLE
jgi:MFS family permease